MPFNLVDEPESVHLDNYDEDIDDSDNPPSSPVDRRFAQGLKSKEDFGPVSEEPPLASLPMTQLLLLLILPFLLLLYLQSPLLSYAAASCEDAKPSRGRQVLKKVLLKSSRVVIC